MAKQSGIIKITGTLDGLNFYMRKGKPVVRKAGGGFTRKSIKGKASMARVRENNSEFGRVSSAKKSFQQSLKQMFGDFREPELHGRMMKLFLNIKNEDRVSARGTRNLEEAFNSEKARKLIKNFQINPELRLPDCLGAKAEMDWAQHELKLSNVDPRMVLRGKDDVKLLLSFGILGFNFQSLEYQFEMAAPVMLGPEDGSEELVFSTVPLPESGGRNFSILGLRVIEMVNGEAYPLEGPGNFGIAVLDLE